jgi:integrase
MAYTEWRGNSWRVRWETGRINPDTGRKAYDSKSGFAEEDTAYKYGLDRESDIRNDRYISRRDGSMKTQELALTWLEVQDLAYDSIRAYRTAITSKINPYWGDKPVADITIPAYEAWAKHIRATCAPNYTKNILMVFSMIMDYAVDSEMRKSSPVIKRRRRGKFTRKTRERKRNLELALVHQLAMNANAVWGYPGYVFFLTVAFTGMRRAELFALRREYCWPNWPASDPREDDDPDEVVRYEEDLERYGRDGDRMPALRVQWQHKFMHGKAVLVPPKYESFRTLVLPPFLAEMFDILLTSHDSPWVFPTISGGSLLQTDWSASYYAPIVCGAEERTGRWARPKVLAVPGWVQPDGKPKRLHLLRHGHKEWLQEDGIPEVASEGRMGHEIDGVRGLYGNVTPAMERQIAAVLQARWERFTGTLGPTWAPPSPIRLPVDHSERQ